MVNRLLLFIFSIILFSCKEKNPQFELSGHVEDAFLGSSLNDVKVTLFKQEVSNGVVNAFYVEETIGYSDANGLFQLNWPNQQVLSYKIKLEKENYYSREIVINPDELQLSTVNAKWYEMFAKSWLNLNVNSSALTGSISFSSPETNEICECESLGNISFTANEPLQLDCASFGNAYLKYVVYDSSGNILFVDSLLNIPFVSNPLLISF
jgi:5-hydroxyisourate hydrolase-like protein (transthyretin family)